MDLATIIGLVVGIGGILLGNIIEGGHVASLAQGAAAVIVFAGTAGAVLVSSTQEEIKKGFSMLKWVFSESEDPNPDSLHAEILDYARLARKESILSLEPKIAQMSDPFMQNVMRHIIDGVDAHTIRDVFENQIEIEEDKMNASAKIWTDAGGFSPTIGIIGAVLGLIHVMGNLTDTSKLGAGIGVAFVATIYGVGSANLIFLPVANKIKKKIRFRGVTKQMILEACLSILAGHHVIVTEQKILSFINQKQAQG